MRPPSGTTRRVWGLAYGSPPSGRRSGYPGRLARHGPATLWEAPLLPARCSLSSARPSAARLVRKFPPCGRVADRGAYIRRHGQPGLSPAPAVDFAITVFHCMAMKSNVFPLFYQRISVIGTRRVRAMATEYGSARAARNHAGLSQVELAKDHRHRPRCTISTAERTGNGFDGHAGMPERAGRCALACNRRGSDALPSQLRRRMPIRTRQPRCGRSTWWAGENGGAMPERLWTDGDFPCGRY